MRNPEGSTHVGPVHSELSHDLSPAPVDNAADGRVVRFLPPG